jgi:hypothetical protein
MMLRGFFDESNRNPKDVHFLIAGWTGRVDEWEKFTKAWDDCLSSSPSIRYFKSSEANRLGGEFTKFSRKQADQKRLSLARIISAHNLRGYFTSANHKIFSGQPKEMKKLMATRIYHWAFMSIVSTILVDRLQREEFEDRIDLIFDGCTELRACIESYENERTNWTPRMQAIAGEVIPGNDKELAGLQAADMLAGELSLHVKTGHPSEHYKAMMTQHLIVGHKFQAPQRLKEVQAYAREVFHRRKVLNAILGNLKKAGIKINDYK